MADEEKDGAAQPADAKKKGGAAGIAMILPAILAGVAAFGGATLGAPKGNPADAPAAQPSAEVPGPTVTLPAFVSTVPDEKGQLHPLKVTVAIELKKTADPKEFDTFVPRIRSATLSYLRKLTYEQAADTDRQEELRTELLRKIHALGAIEADQVMFTDYVMQ